MNKDLFRFGSIAILAMLFVSMYPQISLWMSQGSSWEGSYYVSNYDETGYSAYVNGLVQGNPRKSDPFIKDGGATDYETLYSIQFIPAYAIAYPAKALGISTSTAFIFLLSFVAVLSTIVLIFLFFEITKNSLFATVATLGVLCFGTATAFQGELRYLIEGRVLVDFLPFLRRYQPGLAFPLFFVFCLLFWRSAVSQTSKRALAYAAASGVVFIALVFSYFYLWTAAAAWVACLVLVSSTVGKWDVKRMWASFAVFCVFAGVALVPYFYLLSLRPENLDRIQLLTLTRMPQFASPSMIIWLILAGLTIFLKKRNSGTFDNGRMVLILAFALTPVFLFNQQIVTGRSLQPVHYEIFIANYLVLIAGFLLLWSVIEAKPFESLRKGLVCLGIFAVVWGFFESFSSTTRSSIAAEIRDASVPAIEYASVSGDGGRAVVHATNFVTADFVSTASGAQSLWNAHTSSAGGVSVAENKRLFYLYLYYSGIGAKDLAEALKGNSFEFTMAIFGSERALPTLATSKSEISDQEIVGEAKKFAEFSNGFSSPEASNPILNSIIVPTEAQPDFTNLDRWYTRDAGKGFGLFTVYKLKRKVQ